ncbi:MAG: M20/M25/M40 family metallo-hydrolase [Ruminococcaceae bacterium]|nr:M20/M25/M40 family metallo-hydrolase [Oscillospiraceae bacterium]
MTQNELVQLTKQLCVIPAPSNHEEKRAEFCKNYFERVGAKDAYIDDALNVVVPIDCDKYEDIAVIMAHTDTVFPDMTPFTPREENGRLYCPAVGDDTVHLAFLMLCVADIIKYKKKPKMGLLFVANSGEEGLGNLKGVRKIMEEYASRVKEFITLDGTVKHFVTHAVGSHRYRISITAQGGHSFSAFGNSNALHVASQLVTRLYDIAVPKKDGTKTTYNVGMISGGTSVNTIAQSAEMLYEYRSDDKECLAFMQKCFRETVEKLLSDRKDDQVNINVELIGERPCGGDVDKTAQKALVDRCMAAYNEAGIENIRVDSGSTDCNIPLSLGIPSVCIGIAEFYGAHTREENLVLESLNAGIEAAQKVIGHYFDA